MEPFLRWAGGKRWLAPRLAPLLKDLLRSSGGNYAEPFLGSAAMFFGLAPQQATLSDTNSDLINVYQQVALHHLDIEFLLRKWPVSSEFYYELRTANPCCPVESAARFIYLNRTCYGGLYRENNRGQFNTPYGGGSRTPATMLARQLLERAHFALQNVTVKVTDFEAVISATESGDVVYCDPTYSNVTRGAFDRYGSSVFRWEDQVRLARVAEAAMDRGATLVVSNGCFDELHDLYPAAYRIRLERKKAIGNRALEAKRHAEYILVLDPLSRRRFWERLGKIENTKSRRRFALQFEERPASEGERSGAGGDRKAGKRREAA